MKIVHIIIGLNVGGAEMALKRLLFSPKDSVENVTVISLTDIGVIGKELQGRGYDVHALNLSGVLSFLSVFYRLIKLLREIKPGVVQTWMYHSDLIGGVAAKLAGCKKIFWGIRCTYIPIGNRATYIIMKLCSLLSKYVPDKIICVAESAKKSHVQYGYFEKKLVVIPNGFDSGFFSKERLMKEGMRKLSELDNKGIIIGSVGRYHIDKGQDILIEAARKLIERGYQAHFVLVGKGCDKNNFALVSLIESYGLKKHFSLLGERSDIPTVLASFDIFCMPSRTEGFPNGLGEAMAMSLPCIATDVGDAKILGGDVVKIVDLVSSECLAVGVAELLSMSVDELNIMGSAAANRIHNHYSISSTRLQFQSIHQK